jgi:hypothetical protein
MRRATPTRRGSGRQQVGPQLTNDGVALGSRQLWLSRDTPPTAVGEPGSGGGGPRSAVHAFGSSIPGGYGHRSTGYQREAATDRLLGAGWARPTRLPDQTGRRSRYESGTARRKRRGESHQAGKECGRYESGGALDHMPASSDTGEVARSSSSRDRASRAGR